MTSGGRELEREAAPEGKEAEEEEEQACGVWSVELVGPAVSTDRFGVARAQPSPAQPRPAVVLVLLVFGRSASGMDTETGLYS